MSEDRVGCGSRLFAAVLGGLMGLCLAFVGWCVGLPRMIWDPLREAFGFGESASVLVAVLLIWLIGLALLGVVVGLIVPKPINDTFLKFGGWMNSGED